MKVKIEKIYKDEDVSKKQFVAQGDILHYVSLQLELFLRDLEAEFKIRLEKSHTIEILLSHETTDTVITLT